MMSRFSLKEKNQGNQEDLTFNVMNVVCFSGHFWLIHWSVVNSAYYNAKHNASKQ